MENTEATTIPQKISYVLAIGDPFDGIDLYGPFDDPEDADTWAQDHGDGQAWTIVKLYEAVSL